MTSHQEFFQRLVSDWNVAYAKLSKSPAMQRLEKGDLKLEHYKGYLQETYHHAGINPQIQAYCSMFLKGNPREVVAQFYKHATSEIGHDLLALNDLCALGGNREAVIHSKPLPQTLGLNAFVTHYIQFHNPIGYLGYLFHLEFMPTQKGPSYLHKLESMGIPKTALSFLEEHATVDVAHVKLMENYFKKLVDKEEIYQHVKYVMEATCELHGLMIAAAFENGEKIYGSESKKAA